jgi:calcineurin-like phosphoesterase family protein
LTWKPDPNHPDLKRRTFFSSDHHFSHANAIKYDSRPFQTVDEMNEEMVRRWNVVVGPEDTVIYLGDFSLSKAALCFLPRLNGEKHLIAGNHDACHPAHAKKPHRVERFTQLYLDSGFKSVALEDEIQLGLHRVKLHHMPYSGDHTNVGERYPEWRPKDDGQWLLHGHVHGLWKRKGRMINVGVVHWAYAPVSSEEILELMKQPEKGEAK